MKVGVAIDLGTSGFRAQKIDIENGEIHKTVITMNNPLPGANVMDHLDFAMNYGQDLAHELVIGAFRNILEELGIHSSPDKIAICGNPIQLSLFQGIPIDDLAYAGQRKKAKYNIKEQERKAAVVKSIFIPGLEDLDNCIVVIPPAIKHEVGADALALIVKSGMLDNTDISIATDYGTNAEMALKVGNVIYTGSAAAGPALEGQEIADGTIARPHAISDVSFEDKALRNYVLNDEMDTVKGDLVKPDDGTIIDKGDIEAHGITGTGVISLIDESIKNGLVVLPKINLKNSIIQLQDGIKFNEHDLVEAGRAIGAIRAGHITLCNAAGIGMEDIQTAYMSGAAGTYMDALKAHNIGMIPYDVGQISQIGNTSLIVAREILLSEDRLWELQKIAEEIVGTHVMFAMDDAFKEAYILELSYWGEGMPFKVLKKYLKKKKLPTIDVVKSVPAVEKRVVKDIPVLGEEGLHVLDKVGTYLTMIIEGCEACHKCVKVCPNDALTMEDEDNRVMIRTDLCDGAHCQKCIHACPHDLFKWENLDIMMQESSMEQ
ncbi:methylamine methyltransferase corrinoid protein reductive activase [Methanohalophilus euhalobius]|uniref:Methylamine methyltransferase corrinoid protein reductive activase n=1 Tax=Methanohalophilus euhalobius TaxID=51203 RepID=A0A315A2J0_9EURY|nr:methylamine methyltransferase corrinoid protein reductive activase [Methanohalophilus euhalobius]PQV43344.1 methylamine methyltransferase corrinoid protein reductive activase [Methanohalophilus euhalobius]RNI07653.1 methylamine methyltransferase corrinoid protein reductive activase [Methanohalophilus euhalobius]